MIREPYEIACMATYAGRELQCAAALERLAPQFPEVHVYLNSGSPTPGARRHRNVTWWRAQDHHGDLGDVGKLVPALECRRAQPTDKAVPIVYLCDDDILYPLDYRETLFYELIMRSEPSIVAIHGARLRLRGPIRSYIASRDLFPFGDPLRRPTPVHIVGTGTAAFRVEDLELSLADFPTPNVADLHLAVAAERQGVPRVLISRPRDWLRQLPVRESIGDRLRARDAECAEILGRVAWTPL